MSHHDDFCTRCSPLHHPASDSPIPKTTRKARCSASEALAIHCQSRWPRKSTVAAANGGQISRGQRGRVSVLWRLTQKLKHWQSSAIIIGTRLRWSASPPTSSICTEHSWKLRAFGSSSTAANGLGLSLDALTRNRQGCRSHGGKLPESFRPGSPATWVWIRGATEACWSVPSGITEPSMIHRSDPPGQWTLRTLGRFGKTFLRPSIGSGASKKRHCANYSYPSSPLLVSRVRSLLPRQSHTRQSFLLKSAKAVSVLLTIRTNGFKRLLMSKI